jgi:hypothetical protein
MAILVGLFDPLPCESFDIKININEESNTVQAKLGWFWNVPSVLYVPRDSQPDASNVEVGEGSGVKAENRGSSERRVFDLRIRGLFGWRNSWITLAPSSANRWFIDSSLPSARERIQAPRSTSPKNCSSAIAGRGRKLVTGQSNGFCHKFKFRQE